VVFYTEGRAWRRRGRGDHPQGREGEIKGKRVVIRLESSIRPVDSAARPAGRFSTDGPEADPLRIPRSVGLGAPSAPRMSIAAAVEIGPCSIRHPQAPAVSSIVAFDRPPLAGGTEAHWGNHHSGCRRRRAFCARPRRRLSFSMLASSMAQASSGILRVAPSFLARDGRSSKTLKPGDELQMTIDSPRSGVPGGA
jgi:hypothetical protein